MRGTRTLSCTVFISHPKPLVSLICSNTYRHGASERFHSLLSVELIDHDRLPHSSLAVKNGRKLNVSKFQSSSDASPNFVTTCDWNVRLESLDSKLCKNLRFSCGVSTFKAIILEPPEQWQWSSIATSLRKESLWKHPFSGLDDTVSFSSLLFSASISTFC